MLTLVMELGYIILNHLGRFSNKVWAAKNSKRPVHVIAKCILSAKKVLYASFFSGEGTATQVLVKKGKSFTRKNYKLWY